MTPVEKVARLSSKDLRLLRRIIDSNGGGVEFSFAAGFHEIRLVPKAQEKRLIDRGLIRAKPNHAGMFIHTNMTRKALQDTNQSTSGSEEG